MERVRYPKNMDESDSEKEKRVSAWSKIRNLFNRPSIPGEAHIDSQARPMTIQEKLDTTRSVMHSEEDPERRSQLAKTAVRLRKRVESKKSLKQKATLTAGAVGAAAVMAGAPAISQGISDAASGAKEAASAQIGRVINSPEPSIEAGKQKGAEVESARQKEREIDQNPTPPLWERTAVPAGQEPTPQPKIDPTTIKQT